MVIDLSDPYADYREPVETDRILTDEETVDVGIELEVIHTPGKRRDSCASPSSQRIRCSPATTG